MELTTFVPIQSGLENAKWRKNIQRGGRRFKAEEEDSKRGKKIQSGGRRFKVDVVFINIIIFILIISGTIATTQSRVGS